MVRSFGNIASSPFLHVLNGDVEIEGWEQVTVVPLFMSLYNLTVSPNKSPLSTSMHLCLHHKLLVAGRHWCKLESKQDLYEGPQH